MDVYPVNLGFTFTPEDQSVTADERVGFKFGAKGTHSSRTIMSDELSNLLCAASPTATRTDYRSLIINDNCLGKRTTATRRLSYQRLSEMYALDPEVLLFRVMRQLWQVDARGHPLLALLLALARDPLLRVTATPILRLRPDEMLDRQAFTDALTRGTGSRFNEAVVER